MMRLLLNNLYMMISICFILVVLYITLGYQRVTLFPLGYIRKYFNLREIKDIGVLINEKEIFEDILKNTVYDSSLNYKEWKYQENGILRYNLETTQEDKVFLLSIYLYEKLKEKYGKNTRVNTIYEFNFENNEKKKQLLSSKYKKLNVFVYFIYEEIYNGNISKYTTLLRKNTYDKNII